MQETRHPQEPGPLPRNREAVDWWLKKWGRQAVVDGQEPLTRDDVERLIKVNAGTAVGLDLSERGMKSAVLDGADLRGAKLIWANLQGANLHGANLQNADLHGANLQGADLAWVCISPDTNLEEVKWDKEYISVLERQGHYGAAIDLYRTLKEWYNRTGMRTIAGEFHYRERETARKAQWKSLGNEFKELKQGMMTEWRRLRGKENSIS